MRQLFKRTRVLLPLLALLALPATGFGQRSWSERFDTIPASKMPDGNPAAWSTFLPMMAVGATVLSDWNSAAAATSKWHSNPECQDAMGYTRDAIQNADIQAGIGSQSLAGEYFGDEDVIVIHVQVATSPGGFGTLIEEAWHRSTGDSDADIDELNVHLDTMYAGRSLQSCHDEAREEEEDEEEPNGGQTCTEEPYTYTESVPVWTMIEAGSCVGVGGVGIPFPQGPFEEDEEGEGNEEPHCTPAVWGWVYEDQERTGMRTVCVLNN